MVDEAERYWGRDAAGWWLGVRLQLSVLAYNLGNLWRRLVLPPQIKRWSLTSLQQRLVKTGADWWSTPGTTGSCWRKGI